MDVQMIKIRHNGRIGKSKVGKPLLLWNKESRSFINNFMQLGIPIKIVPFLHDLTGIIQDLALDFL